MHYYGDASLYDYDNNQFGFTRGDLSAVRDKSNQPLGAGPYKFVKYENKTVYMEANENYYKGAPKTKYLQWRETSDADKIAVCSRVQSTFPIHPEANLHLIRSRALTETMNSAVIRSSLTQQTTWIRIHRS